MSDVLVGSTGFVGRNILNSKRFAKELHSANVRDAYGMSPELLVYAGVPSEMFTANSNPDLDLDVMRRARDNIRNIGAKKVVLISTIAVYGDCRGKTELDEPNESALLPYGRNRLSLEKWVREDFDNALIVRLPALYGRYLKKNFVYDLIHIAPALLTRDKFVELVPGNPEIADLYEVRDEKFYRQVPGVDQRLAKEVFEGLDFNALSFTDSRSRFQFYGLDCLWSDVEAAVANGWETLNISPEPLSAQEVYSFVKGGEWSNELGYEPFDYDMRSIHFDGGYLCSKEQVLSSLDEFVRSESERLGL